MTETLFFILFLVLVVLLLALDMGVFHKKDHNIGFKEALFWTIVWISVALLFYVLLVFKAEWTHGINSMQDLVQYKQHYANSLPLNENLPFIENLKVFRDVVSLEYLTGYLIEKALSLDNIFVILLIFTSFKVETKYYHRVLFYGIIGAIVMRFAFIFLSSTLIQHFHWILLIFGAFLAYSGIKIFFEKQKKEMKVEKHPVVRFFSKLKLSTPNYYGHNFFVKIDGKRLLTPLFVVLIVIEFSDVIFAVDSIPAIFSVTHDPYIVFYSNIFAILGLRSLFFVLQSIIDKFRFLKTGLACLLAFIGIKMILPFLMQLIQKYSETPVWDGEISTPISLLAIVGILAASIAASLIVKNKK
ncbi:membrane protein [Bacteroidia bacterium]|nr:membrane protein [Bacteroidia bacterium]